VNAAAQFIRRPVATSLMMVGVLLLGIVAYARLPIASLPAVERPTVEVYAPFPGASPNTVASALAQPLETTIGLIPGVVEMSSFSGTGGTDIVTQFDLSIDLDTAAGAVQAAINAAGTNLPKGFFPPFYWKANPAGFAVIALAMTSDVIPSGEVYDFADSVLSPKLSQLPGVARVYITGGEKSAVRVQVSPGRLAGMNLSLEAVRLAIVAASQNLPKGAISVDSQRYTIEANDQLLRAADYRDVPVAWRNGAPVRLGDVATITDSVINNKLAGWFGTERGVVLYVYKQPDANVVETVDAVKAILPELEHWLPPAVKLRVVYDRTSLIRAAVADVELTLAIASLLVVVVIALFLKRFWATVIPSITIPVSLAATLFVMSLCGYSLDNLSLMALTIATGFVVDDAIIMIENIIRRMANGETALDAAIGGVRQMAFTVISITAALVAALIPILFMPDIVGRYFREFGITLVVAIVSSAAVSLTLTPMLCGHLLGRRKSGSADAAGHGQPHARSRVGAGYARSLDWTLRHRIVTMTLTLTVTAACVWLYLILPKGFMPTQDTGVMFVRTIAPANISFAAMEDRQRVVGEAILADPAVSGLTSYIGEGNGGALSTGQMLVALKPPEQRKLPIQQVIARLRDRMAKVDGIRVFFIPLQDLNLGAQSGGSRYQYTLWGVDDEEVIRTAEAIIRRVRALPEVTDVIQSWETNGLQAGLAIDRLRAAALGVTPVAIDNTLYDAFGQRQVNLLFLPSNFSRVIFEVEPRSATDPSVMSQLYVRGSNGGAVPMSALTRPVRAHASMWVRHSAQFPAATISFDTKPGVSIGEAITAIRAAEAAVRLPDGVRAEFRGEAREADNSGFKQMVLFAAAIIAIYIALGVLYESYVHPLTILSTLPPTVFGALVALWAAKIQFTLVTSIACILLVGMVMKNAIMMVDFALEAERNRRLDARQAIHEAALLRVRPITMTMLAAILSAVPIAIGTGPGYELRQPLGIAIVGGLIVAQLFTLYTTPVIYLMMDGLRRRGPAPAALPHFAAHDGNYLGSTTVIK
jgi:hydrophobe/amphiphile efflux-1 (HAE1) family protein